MVRIHRRSALVALWLVVVTLTAVDSTWLSREAATEIVEEFERQEKTRGEKEGRGADRRGAYPFITGDGFRHHCSPHICEDGNRCRMEPEKVKDGDCVFVKTDLFEMFMVNVAPNIKNKYVLVSHNGDLSAPDGQTDAPRIGMPKYEALPLLQKQYDAGLLLAHHGQNTWWRKYGEGGAASKPPFVHCLPIGFENRQYRIGSNPQMYADMLRKNVVNRPERSVQELSARPLLLMAFYPKSRVPDRAKVFGTLGASWPPKGGTWFNLTDLDHNQWLNGISEHRFVLAPFGHGLDTHRISEILLMGGIPVMRKSSISSCYDDSDNSMGSSGGSDRPPRGSIPGVFLNSWEELTQERLEKEWEERYKDAKPQSWDHRRLLLPHWLDRIANMTASV
jgi:hypothetical protein